MNYTVKQHSKNEFYPIYCKWLEGHNFPAISELVLPENVFVFYSDDVPCYCIWLYFTDSKLCWIAFPASNKNVNFKKREKGLEFLMNHVLSYCKKKKIKMVLTTSNTSPVIESLKNSGFETGDQGVNHYYKIL